MVPFAMSVRRASVDDIDSIVDLRIEFLRAFHEIEDEVSMRSTVGAYLRRTLPTDDCVAWVGDVGGATVGTGMMTIYERPSWDGVSKEGYVLNMYTRPEHRGAGIATSIVGEMLAYGSENALRLCLIATDEGRPIYERAGFEADPRYLRWRA